MFGMKRRLLIDNRRTSCSIYDSARPGWNCIQECSFILASVHIG
jgi:hypothetical protein